MKQPIKGGGKLKKKKTPVITKKRKTPFSKSNNSNQKYGTSQLERDFASEFLDKYGLKYIYQFEAKEIGRYFDFAVMMKSGIDYIMEEKDGLMSIRQENQCAGIAFLIEVDGSYYHSDPRLVNEDKLNPMQKHNKFIDKLKDQWAALHCIPLLRLWEYDIRKNPKMIIEKMSKYIKIGEKKRIRMENMNRPH